MGEEALDYLPRDRRRAKLPPTVEQATKFHIAYLVILGVVGAAAAVFLWNCRLDPGGGEAALGGACLLFSVFTGGGATLTGLWLTRVVRFDEPWRRRLAVLWPMLATVVTLALALVLAALDVPFHLAFGMAKSGMERAALRVLADPKAGDLVGWVGVLPVEKMEVHGGDVLVHVRGSQGIDTTSFLDWTRGGPVPVWPDAIEVRPIGGDWYWVNQF